MILALLAAWRALFLFAEAPIVGAGILLLIARLTGADWEAALRPLLRPAVWLLPAAIPVVIHQALIPAPPHLALWLSWPLFALRSLVALGFWWWLSRRAPALGKTGAGLALLAHAVIVDVIAVDWIMAVAPGQPQTAIGMALAVAQILAACASACVLRLGSETQRRDLSRLMIATCLGLAYMLFVDFVIVWYGNLPSRIGWYLHRMASPWSLMPPIALLCGLFAPIATITANQSKRWAGGGALLGLALALCWQVLPR